MGKLVLPLEFVTPLFLGGADQQPELRPASVRGALRYWFRAIAGGALEGGRVAENLKALRERESAVFGDTTAASAVTVRLTGTARWMEEFAADKRRRPGVATGHDYLYFSAIMQQRIPFAPHPAGADASQSDVRLILSTRREPARGPKPLQQAGAAAWLLTTLGGLGSRSRRCAGSIQVGGAPDATLDGLPPFAVAAASVEALRDELAAGLRMLRSLYGTASAPSHGYDVLHPDLCRVWVVGHGEAGRSGKGAVDRTGAAMQEFRQRRGVVANSIFGLPIKNLLPRDSLGLSRRSSPLWLRVTRLVGGEFVTVATLFKSEFAENVGEVGDGYALIEEFVGDELKGLEVDYR